MGRGLVCWLLLLSVVEQEVEEDFTQVLQKVTKRWVIKCHVRDVGGRRQS